MAEESGSHATQGNPFVWIELVTSDIEAAARFYADVVGWSAEDAGMEFPYTLMQVGERPQAGIMPIPPGSEGEDGVDPAWIGHIGVDDVDEAVRRVVAAGGSVHRESEDIPGVGRFALLADPQGVVFGVYAPTDPPQGEPPHPMSPGEVGWHELMTTDREGAWSFYSELFGWRKGEALDMGPAGIYQLFGLPSAEPGVDMGGMMETDEFPRPYWSFYFSVPDIDAATEKVKAAGGEIWNGPMEVPGGAWIINGRDPQGAVFSLVAPPKDGQGGEA